MHITPRMISLSLIVAATGGASAQSIQSGPIFNPANGHAYYLLTPSNRSNAQAAAERLGGNLVTIDNAAENTWVRTTFGGTNRRLWIGLQDPSGTNNWVWASGATSTYRNWATGEPNNIGTERFVEMVSTTTTGIWNNNDETAGTLAVNGVVEIDTPYDIDFYAITPGGTLSTASGSFSVSGTIGPAHASGQLFDSSGEDSIVSGFWGPFQVFPCPCAADFDRSGGTPDTTDIDAFFTSWLLGDAQADADCSGGTPDSQDINVFFQQWLAGGC
jgi:hypothetical protein